MIDTVQSLVKEARTVRKNRGNRAFVIEGIQFMYRKTIRSVLPVKRHALWNGVKVPPQVAHKRRSLDQYLPRGWHLSDLPNSEGGEVSAHKIFTHQGDDVVIIGGGRGVTAVHASWQVEPDGSVTVYEGSQTYVKIIDCVLELNSVKEFCEVRNVVVGPGINIYGGESGSRKRTVSPNQLEACDVLEMDCEGAELEILRNLKIRPRVLIVEMHPAKYSGPSNAILSLLDEMNYQIKGRWSNSGEQITKAELKKILKQNKKGDAPAPVVAAKHTSYTDNDI